MIATSTALKPRALLPAGDIDAGRRAPATRSLRFPAKVSIELADFSISFFCASVCGARSARHAIDALRDSFSRFGEHRDLVVIDLRHAAGDTA